MQEFKYIEYGKKIYDEIFQDYQGQENILFVVANELEKYSAVKYYGEYFLFEANKIVSMEELKELTFADGNLLLREEKRLLVLYDALTQEIKQKLGIRDYYDFIEIGNNFMNFYSEMGEQGVDSAIDLTGWQEELLSVFDEMKELYKKELIKYEYTDRIFQNSLTNFKWEKVSGYDKIIFAGIVNFTGLEKEMIEIFESNGKDIIIYNQIEKGDFDEEELTLKKVTIPTSIKSKDIKILESVDNDFQTGNIFYEIYSDEENPEIIDVEDDSYITNVLSRDRFDIREHLKFSETITFNYFSLLYELLNNAVIIDKKRYLEAKSVFNAVSNKYLRKRLGISHVQYNLIKSQIVDGYKYFNEETEGVLPVLEIVEKLEGFTTINDYVEYLKEFEVFIEDLNLYQNADEMFYSSLSEMEAIEKLEIIKDWGEFFGKRVSGGLFRLVLKYLRFKAIKRNVTENEDKIRYKSIGDINSETGNTRYILNLIEGKYPTKDKTQFLLTDNQRKNLGLNTFENTRLLEKYKLIQLIMNSEKVKLFAIKNGDKNIEISSFVEEISDITGITIEKGRYSNKNYKEYVNSINGREITSYGKLAKKEEELSKEYDDFNDGIVNIGSYSFQSLNDCMFKYYFESVVKLEESYKEIEKKLEIRDLGIFAHVVMDKICKEKRLDILNGNFELNKDTLKLLLKRELEEMKTKIPVEYYIYYSNIVLDEAAAGIEYFFKRLGGLLSYKKTYEFEAEKSSKSILEGDELVINLSGRADLIIKNEGGGLIIDFKTGGSNTSQLDFYSYLFSEDQEEYERYIYNIFGKELKKADKVRFDKETIEEKVNEFIKSDEYKRAEKHNICRYCRHINICRPGWY